MNVNQGETSLKFEVTEKKVDPKLISINEESTEKVTTDLVNLVEVGINTYNEMKIFQIYYIEFLLGLPNESSVPDFLNSNYNMLKEYGYIPLMADVPKLDSNINKVLKSIPNIEKIEEDVKLKAKKEKEDKKKDKKEKKKEKSLREVFDVYFEDAIMRRKLSFESNNKKEFIIGWRVWVRPDNRLNKRYDDICKNEFFKNAGNL